ncbi:MAG: hypothetical protein HZA78_06810 [Candidatus Schekmanbacteria bacterium]|nr:hypothetical protein [Candidatus Schekmanbacteria bacterium]
MKSVNVKVQGISPLLQHRYVFTDEKEEAAKKRSGKKDYSEEWKSALYWDNELGVIQPAGHLEAAMIKAAVNFQIVGKGKKTYKDLFKSAVFVSPDYIPHGLKGSKEDLVQEGRLTIDKRLVRVNNSGVERLRPMLKNWLLEFMIEIHDEQISADTVHQVLEHAGRYVGIGDFRPKFGRFSVVKFE